MGTFQEDAKKGIVTRLEKAAMELNELEAAIKFIRADVDPNVLRDFREAVDHVRLTAWGVQTWLEERGKGYSPYPLLPILTDERIRRATQLCNQLADEVKALELHIHGQGVEKFEQLFRAIDRLHRPLAPLFKP